MRCPACRARTSPDDYACAECGRRPFTWLGDPFGTQELPGATAAILSAAPPRPTGRLTPGKLVAATLVVALAALHAPLLAAGLALVAAFLVRSCPKFGWRRLLLLLLFFALVWVMFVPAARAMEPSNRSLASQPGPAGVQPAWLMPTATIRIAALAERHQPQAATTGRQPGDFGRPRRGERA
jgi:hypothetical protein